MTKTASTKKAPRKSTGPKRKRVKTLDFLEKPGCATCQKAKRFLEKHGYRLNVRNLMTNKLSSSELGELIGKRDPQDFLNTKSEVYRKKRLGVKCPSRREAVGMMAMNPDLIRRPVIVAGGRVVIGYDENGMIRF